MIRFRSLPPKARGLHGTEQVTVSPIVAIVVVQIVVVIGFLNGNSGSIVLERKNSYPIVVPPIPTYLRNGDVIFRRVNLKEPIVHDPFISGKSIYHKGTTP